MKTKLFAILILSLINNMLLFGTKGNVNNLSIIAPPSCTNLNDPIDGATDVSIITNLSWNAVSDATGYKLNVGTTSGGTDILNNKDVANTTTYDFIEDLPCGTTIYVLITPYNADGEATTCDEESFTTESVTADAGSDVEICIGGSVQLLASGGSTYSWSPTTGLDNPEINNPIASPDITTTYIVTVSNDGRCPDTDEVEVKVNSNPVPNANAQDESGNNYEDGEATCEPSGGSPAYAYEWSNGKSTQTITGLPPGDYTVTVTDANNCTASETVNVAEFFCPTLIVVNTEQDVRCNGFSDGSITITDVTNGTSPFVYLWSNGANSNSNTNLSPGSYSVTITDSKNCTVNKSFSISEPDALAFSIAKYHESCKGKSDGQIKFEDVSGGIPAYKYKLNNTSYKDSASFNNLEPGNYEMTLKDQNNCLLSKPNILIESGTLINVEIDPSNDQAACENKNKITLSDNSSSTPPTSLNRRWEWKRNGTTINSTNKTIEFGNGSDNSDYGNYNIELIITAPPNSGSYNADDNVCVKKKPIDVTIYDVPHLTLDIIDGIVCADSIVKVEVEVEDNDTNPNKLKYSWKGNSSNNTSINNIDTKNSGGEYVNYAVTVTDDTNCESNKDSSFYVNTLPEANITVKTYNDDFITNKVFSLSGKEQIGDIIKWNWSFNPKIGIWDSGSSSYPEHDYYEGKDIPYAQVSEAGDYKFTLNVTDKDHCKSSVSEEKYFNGDCPCTPSSNDIPSKICVGSKVDVYVEFTCVGTNIDVATFYIEIEGRKQEVEEIKSSTNSFNYSPKFKDIGTYKLMVKVKTTNPDKPCDDPILIKKINVYDIVSTGELKCSCESQFRDTERPKLNINTGDTRLKCRNSILDISIGNQNNQASYSYLYSTKEIKQSYYTEKDLIDSIQNGSYKNFLKSDASLQHNDKFKDITRYFLYAVLNSKDTIIDRRCRAVSEPLKFKIYPSPEFDIAIDSGNKLCLNTYLKLKNNIKDPPDYLSDSVFSWQNNSTDKELFSSPSNNSTFYFLNEDEYRDLSVAKFESTISYFYENGPYDGCSYLKEKVLNIADASSAPKPKPIRWWPGNILASEADSTEVSFEWGYIDNNNTEVIIENSNSKFLFTNFDGFVNGELGNYTIKDVFERIYFVDTWDKNDSDKDCIARVFFTRDHFQYRNDEYVNNKRLDFIILPNPNNGIFSIKLSKPVKENINILIVSIDGREVFHDSFMSQSTKRNINLNFLARGVYIIRVSTKENGFVHRKLIIK